MDGQSAGVSVGEMASLLFEGEGGGDEASLLQALMISLIRQNVEVASIFDLQSGEFKSVTVNDQYSGPTSGNIKDMFRASVNNVLPECREEYLRNTDLENIKNQLAQYGRYSFQSFFQNGDGVSRKRNIFYASQGEPRYSLAIREDTTDEYLHEQTILQAKGAVAQTGGQSSFISDMLHKHSREHKVLVVEDNATNRDILDMMLSPYYGLHFAENGEMGYQALVEHRDEIDLVLLDLYMPVCDGFSFLERVKSVQDLAATPVVIASSSERPEDEERCLRLGAADFIKKPYRVDDIIPRIRQIIDQNESEALLKALEYDELTGAYTQEAFLYRMGEKMAQAREPYDLMLVHIRDFSTINSIFGGRVGDSVLKMMSSELRRMLPQAQIGRAGRRFLALIPSGRTPSEEHVMECIRSFQETSPVPNLRIHIGIYRDLDASQPAGVLYDRAKMALDSNQEARGHAVAYYNKCFQQQQANKQELLAGFKHALENKEFKIMLQPKVQSSTGDIVAAEALVRWVRSDGNMVRPDAFIPLFEKEGYIKALDEYVFKTVCEFQRQRIDAGKKLIPISVNLSRISMFSSGIAERYSAIAAEQGVSCSFVPIEITESAATPDQAIVDICNQFVQAGFNLHMDDFGSGYSSLSSLSTLPFSVLKLDKSLIDQIGAKKGEVVIKSAVEAARGLGMAIVAEGVESGDQVDYLTNVSCDMIQGYYYFRPQGIDDFNALLDE